ncbi:MAG: 1-deoxy-D-xylulose-5-phosphate reductoisomerase, partial [Clostridiales bacterium]|nr:1-deoxy-D-xylulose-5-phosphate reductoisomerase [Clostridiales bacterium]
VLNGANEAAVAKYLKDEIGFYDIPHLVRHAMDTVPFTERPDLTEILKADRAAREAVEKNDLRCKN